MRPHAEGVIRLRARQLDLSPKTGGRQKGTPNKLNADVKAMILAALAAKGGQSAAAGCGEPTSTRYRSRAHPA